MKNQEIFDEISKIDTCSIKDESIKKVFTLMLNLIENLQQENNSLKEINQSLRDENNRLKGEQGKPTIKPNSKLGFKDISTQGKEGKKKNHKKNVITQDVVFQVKNTCYKLAVYHSSSLGKTYRAKPPKGVSYHCTNLQSFIITLNKVLDVTESKILLLLKSIGIEISKGSISNILLKYTDIAQQEKQEIIKAGLVSSYVQTDITGTRVCGKNNYSNIITNPLFTSYINTKGKSHLDVLAAFQKIPDLYQKKNIFIKVKSALAIAHYIYQDQYPKVYCLVSDNAPEYNKISLEYQSLCWVHDARYYKKLNPALEIHRERLHDFIGLYWEFYHKLLDYKKAPNKELATKLETDFDTLFTTKTNYFQLDKLIEKTFKNKDKLLTVLQKPAIPLHNNLAELGARRKVRKRDISYHTMSDIGTRCLDAFMTITQTAIQLNVDVFKYIKQMIDDKKDRVTLAELIKLKL